MRMNKAKTPVQGSKRKREKKREKKKDNTGTITEQWRGHENKCPG